MHLCYSFHKMTVFSAQKRRREKELRAVLSEEGIWYKSSRAFCNISVHTGEWRIPFLPLLCSHLSSVCTISSSNFVGRLSGWKKGQANRQWMYQKLLSVKQENGCGSLAWAPVYRSSVLLTPKYYVAKSRALWVLGLFIKQACKKEE